MRTWLLIVATLVFALGACGGGKSTGDTTAKPSATLYDRLGGSDAIAKVVDEFVSNVAADARVKDFFAKTDIPMLKKHLVDQICNATGGPCEYTGRDMKTVHKGMGVTEAHWNATVEDLVKALDTFGVKDTEKNELLAILGTLKPDIVGQ